MSQWNRRRRRAEHLVARQPHAEALLRYYVDLLVAQERVCVRAAGWRPGKEPSGTGLDLHQVPAGELDIAFLALLEGLAATGTATDVIRTACESLAAHGEAARSALLRATAVRESTTAPGADPPVTAPALLALACLQPIAEVMARDRPAGTNVRDPTCPRCGWPPLVAEIRDDGDVRGRRVLVCALCASAWSFPRGVCPACGEARSDRIDAHVAESLPHIRVEACATCQTYLKSIDLRIDGRAVAQPDDVGSIELDVWAHEQGLRKLQTNVLGS